MNALQPLRRLLAQTSSDMRTPIATLSGPSALGICIAQPLHQLCPRPGSAFDPPPRLLWLARETVPRKSWDDQMEGIFGSLWVDKLLDNMSKLEN